MSRTNLTAALLVALGATMSTSALAGSVLSVNAGHLGKARPVELASNLNLGIGASFQATRSQVVTQRGTVKTREQQIFNGVPIYGRTVVVERDGAGNVLSVRGVAEKNIGTDLASVTPKLSAAQAQAAVLKARGVPAGLAPTDEKAELFVYPATSGAKARLVYLVSYVLDSGNGASRPTAFVDANSGQIIAQWEGITSGRLPTPTPATNVNVEAAGIGGNATVGSYFYGDGGTGHDPLQVQRNGLTCYMQNDRIVTYNMAGGTARGVVWSFPCAKAPYASSGDSINGGFSPINDAHHFGGVVHDMYTEWFGAPPLINPDGSEMKLVMRVHYGVNYGNAFWNGTSMTFGDGNGVNVEPFVMLDVTGHEISHGFTGQHSGLEYTGQSGGMNEAFSDMAGEAVKFFDRGSNDFLVGADFIVPGTVAPGGLAALRDMCTPSRDGSSIDTADEFTADMDPHYSSGAYNRAFCVLAKTEGWNTRKAFEVFHDANAVAWQPDETFDGGACGVEQAATDRGYNAADVTAAFDAVKVECKPIALSGGSIR
ncbi:M4 family metallopeptidase [Rhodanobacter sp. Col0626]|uniref:M4 family metallopeptidase n=1 Tax=Rhodanobacter sp. Col0626 TaxID=3415679 RepID=UPI003CF396F5